MPKASAQARSCGCPADPISGRIRVLREGVSLTAIALDRLTGLCPGTVARLERGHQKIYASHLYRIAQVTGVDVGWFYRNNATPSTPPTASGASLQAQQQQRLLDAYMRIKDPAMKRDVFELIETLAKAVPGKAAKN